MARHRTRTPSSPRRATRRAGLPATVFAAVAALLLTLFSPLQADAEAAPCTQCTLFGTEQPPNGADPEQLAIEVGVRFKPKTDGRILGIRFWKDTANTGVHTGRLWNTADGTSTAVTFSSETASGWQQALFTQPEPVTAGATYIASYTAPNGRYTATENFFTQAKDSEQLTAPATAVGAGNGVYRYGTGGGMPTDSWNASNYWVDAVFQPANDTTPPTVTATAPANQATGTAVNAPLSATFSEDVQPATVTWNVRKTSDNSPVAGTATHATGKSTFTPAAALALSTGYTATVSGAKDSAGNTLAAPVTWTFTTAATVPSTTTVSIFTGNEPVAQPNNDNNAVTLGVKFRATSDGFVKAVRFFKTTANTGPFSVSLWEAGGAPKGTIDNVTLTGSGWQTVTLPTPVAVTAGTTYVASYFTRSGNYAVDNDFFTGKSAGNDRITALASGTDGKNGVYAYGTANTFPNASWRDSNYWVDVVFDTNGQDTTAPTITAQVPGPNATGVPVAVQPNVKFNEPVQPATVTLGLKKGATTVAGTQVLNDPAQVTFAPTAPLDYNTQYTLTLSPVKDAAGNQLPGTTWTFTTGQAPPAAPCTATGTGPILVVTTQSNPFTCYYSEILRNEGLNSFSTLDAGAVNPTELAKYTTVILGDLEPSATLVQNLTTWVNGGGSLIAMRPRAALAPLLGLNPAGGTMADQYIQVNATTAPGAGIQSARSMQYHGAADLWTAAPGTQTVAELFRRTGSAQPAGTGNAAVTLRPVGSGFAGAFTYDLAKSVVQTRQGNPSQANQETDHAAVDKGNDVVRSSDLYYRDWIDLSRVDIPQADEQQRLLANMIEQVNRDKAVVPRFWYMPGTAGSPQPGINKAVLVSTGDHHKSPLGGVTGKINKYTANSDPACSGPGAAQAVKDWKCLRTSVYAWNQSQEIDRATAQGWAGQGFEWARHIETNDGCVPSTPGMTPTQIDATLANAFTSSLNDFANGYPAIPPVSDRIHCLSWPDWISVAEAEAANGIRMDVNYYYMPNGWTNSYGGPAMENSPGFFTGSGMPMRFADSDGRMIDVYQAATQMTDEMRQTYPQTFQTMVDKAKGADGFYGAFVINNHLDSGNANGGVGGVSQQQIEDAMITAAKNNGIPVVTAKQLLEWTDARNRSKISAPVRTGDNVTFTVTADAAAANLMTMLPTAGAGGTVLNLITRSGAPVPFSKQTVKGIEYAILAGTTGTYTAAYAAPPAAPLVLAPTAAPQTDGTADVNWATDTAATTEVAVGTDADKLTPAATVGEQAGEHKTKVGGLKADTTYFYRVTSTDPGGRKTVWPAPNEKPAKFKTPKADKAAPKISDVQVKTWPDGTADVTWKTDEPADSKLFLGPGLRDMKLGSADDKPGTLHTAKVGGLAPGQSYLFRAESVDKAGNRAQWSGKKADTARFVMPRPGVAEHDASTFTTGERQGGVFVDRNAGTLRGSGTYTSALLDAGQMVNWLEADWKAAVPRGGSMKVWVRTGTTTTPDRTWTDWRQISAPGVGAGGGSRYLQYRVELNGAELAGVSFTHDGLPPAVEEYGETH